MSMSMSPRALRAQRRATGYRDPSTPHPHPHPPTAPQPLANGTVNPEVRGGAYTLLILFFGCIICTLFFALMPFSSNRDPSISANSPLLPSAHTLFPTQPDIHWHFIYANRLPRYEVLASHVSALNAQNRALTHRVTYARSLSYVLSRDSNIAPAVALVNQKLKAQISSIRRFVSSTRRTFSDLASATATILRSRKRRPEHLKEAYMEAFDTIITAITQLQLLDGSGQHVDEPSGQYFELAIASMDSHDAIQNLVNITTTALSDTQLTLSDERAQKAQEWFAHVPPQDYYSSNLVVPRGDLLRFGAEQLGQEGVWDDEQMGFWRELEGLREDLEGALRILEGQHQGTFPDDKELVESQLCALWAFFMSQARELVADEETLCRGKSM